jgi:8-amino-7-oxononanoate synthase
MAGLDDYLSIKLSKRQNEGLLRTLKHPASLADFCSNDYLGLARSQELMEMIQSAFRQLRPLRNGSTGSRLLSGNSAYHEEVEHKLAGIFRSDAALLFNSGYTANLAVFSSIPGKDDTILYDEFAHASIKDGARLSLAKKFSFFHNDLNDLEKKIRRSAGRIFIAVESIYSMDGDLCPLREIVRLAKTHDAFIILDEAHSTGVHGGSGSGIATELNIADQIAIRVYTFGKAMGIHGACVAGSEPLKQFMVNFARPLIYTTAPDNHDLVSIDCAFAYLSAHLELQKQLAMQIKLFRRHAEGVPGISGSESSIQTAIIPGNESVKKAAHALQTKGFDIRPILSPTVPRGRERLRICLHTFNTEQEIVELAAALAELVAIGESDYLSQ